MHGHMNVKKKVKICVLSYYNLDTQKFKKNC
jgi:hypothetical protein